MEIAGAVLITFFNLFTIVYKIKYNIEDDEPEEFS
jgi:hypothetical protein